MEGAIFLAPMVTSNLILSNKLIISAKSQRAIASFGKRDYFFVFKKLAWHLERNECFVNELMFSTTFSMYSLHVTVIV